MRVNADMSARQAVPPLISGHQLRTRATRVLCRLLRRVLRAGGVPVLGFTLPQHRPSPARATVQARTPTRQTKRLTCTRARIAIHIRVFLRRQPGRCREYRCLRPRHRRTSVRWFRPHLLLHHRLQAPSEFTPLPPPRPDRSCQEDRAFLPLCRALCGPLQVHNHPRHPADR